MRVGIVAPDLREPGGVREKALFVARSLTRPGMSAQNHPNRRASGRATRKAAGASSHVTDNVKASADEILR